MDLSCKNNVSHIEPPCHFPVPYACGICVRLKQNIWISVLFLIYILLKLYEMKMPKVAAYCVV